ncbi:hypothetical protein H8959_012797 [Pygathrix nigripes]
MPSSLVGFVESVDQCQPSEQNLRKAPQMPGAGPWSWCCFSSNPLALPEEACRSPDSPGATRDIHQACSSHNPPRPTLCSHPSEVSPL